MLSPDSAAATKRRRPYTKRLRYSPSGVLQPGDCDGRSRFARRFLKVSEELAAEIGLPLSPRDRLLIERATKLLLLAETEAEPDLAIRFSSEGRRLLDGLRPKGGAKNKPDTRVMPMRERLLLEEDAAFEDAESASA